MYVLNRSYSSCTSCVCARWLSSYISTSPDSLSVSISGRWSQIPVSIADVETLKLNPYWPSSWYQPSLYMPLCLQTLKTISPSTVDLSSLFLWLYCSCRSPTECHQWRPGWWRCASHSIEQFVRGFQIISGFMVSLLLTPSLVFVHYFATS